VFGKRKRALRAAGAGLAGPNGTPMEVGGGFRGQARWQARGGVDGVLKVAIVGCGGIGNTHARQLVQDPLAQLVACCDILRDRADATAARFGARPYYDVDAMLQAEEIDAVTVATAGADNGADHYEPTMRCLAAGKHVLVEKPICNDLGKAKAMVARAREKGVQLAVDLNHRFVPMAERARDWIIGGRMGELLLCNMELWIANGNESSPWFHLRALHSHSIDVMRYFCGEVRRVSAFLGHSQRRAIWSNCVINLEFANGCLGGLFGSYEAAPRHGIERCEVLGTKGRFVLENVMEDLQFFPHDSDEIVRYRWSMMGSGPRSFDETFRNRIHRWLEQLQRGEPVDGSGEEGLRALAVIEAAILSFKEGRVVDVDELLAATAPA
jgi:predicted dehydrogenase